MPIITTSDSSISEPPTKKIKSGLDVPLIDLINTCFDLKFNKRDKSESDEEYLTLGNQRIRETIEQATSSSDVLFGTTRTRAKINWGKCLGLLLEEGPQATAAIKVLTERLSTGGGLL